MNYENGPNIEWSSDEAYALPRITVLSPAANEIYFSSGTMPIEWSNTGPLTRINIYWRAVGAVDWIPIAKNYPNTGNYVWNIPFMNASTVIISGETTKAFVQTTTGESARLRAIIDSLGSVSNIIVFEGGFAYEGTDEIEVSDETITTVAPTISANVVSGAIVGSTIYAIGSGFITTPVNNIELKIESSNNERIYAHLTKTITYKADVTNGSDILTNIVPDISIQQNLDELELYIGMPVSGAGILIGSTISQILAATNQIQITNNANLTSTITVINGGTLNGSITIK